MTIKMGTARRLGIRHPVKPPGAPKHCPNCGHAIHQEFIKVWHDPNRMEMVPGRWDCSAKCWQHDYDSFFASLKRWEARRG